MMKQTISVRYVSQSLSPHEIGLDYLVNKGERTITVDCTVDNASVVPPWLQLKKFDVTAQRGNGSYTVMYNERNDSKNVDCSLFILKAYVEIMRREKIKVDIGGPL